MKVIKSLGKIGQNETIQTGIVASYTGQARVVISHNDTKLERLIPIIEDEPITLDIKDNGIFQIQLFDEIGQPILREGRFNTLLVRIEEVLQTNTNSVELTQINPDSTYQKFIDLANIN